MSELPPRPPAPGSNPGKPEKKPKFKAPKAKVRKEGRLPQTNQIQSSGPGIRQEGEQEEEEKGHKKSRLMKQLKPTLVMLALIIIVAFLYMSVRAAREALTPPEPTAATLPRKAGSLSLEIPRGFKAAGMKPVAGSSSRWAFGRPGATDYALFITRYPLKKNPQDDSQRNQLIKEARKGIAQTGGPKRPKLVATEKIGGQDAYRYSFKTQKLWVDLWLVLHTNDQKAALYQFSCQSRPGEKGNTMRERCAEILDTVKFSNKLA